MDALLEAIFSAILEPLLEALGYLLSLILATIGYLLLWALIYLVSIPFFCVLLTPVVLISAAFGLRDYEQKVRSGYRGICEGLAAMGAPVW